MTSTYKITWSEVDECCEKLLLQIRDAEYFETILAITRGGLVPGTILAYSLEIKDLISCNIKAYTKKKILNQPTFVHSLSPKLLNGRHVLIVDDILDSGKTMTTLTDFLSKETSARYKVASLFYKERSVLCPDFYGKKIGNNIWLQFPWEVAE